MPKTKKPTVLHCQTCGQVITEQHAMEQERKRLAERAKKEEAGRALEKAYDDMLERIEKLLKQINTDFKGKFKLFIDESWGGEDLKNPIGLLFGVEVAGLTTRDSLDTLEDMVSIKAFFKKLGYTLQ